MNDKKKGGILVVLLIILAMASTLNTSAISELVGPVGPIDYYFGDSQLVTWTYFHEGGFDEFEYIIRSETQAHEFERGVISITSDDPVDIVFDLIALFGQMETFLSCAVIPLDLGESYDYGFFVNVLPPIDPDITPPIISDVPDLVIYEHLYSEFTNITWVAYDEHPAIYRIQIDGDFVTTDNWYSGEDLIYDASYQYLPVGIYEIDCTVWDTFGNEASDTVIVSVVTQFNWAFEPTDQTITFGETLDYYISVNSYSNVASWWFSDTENFITSITDYHGGSSCHIETIPGLLPGDYVLDILVTDYVGQTLEASITLSVLEQVFTIEPTAELKLSGSFDYLEKEEINLQIAGILTNSLTGAILTGATVTFEIYNPTGVLVISGDLAETYPGIYVYQTDGTVKDLKDILAKGIYIVSAYAITLGGLEAFDMIEFHIDPPGETAVVLPIWGISLIVGLLALSGGSIGGFYLRKLRF